MTTVQNDVDLSKYEEVSWDALNDYTIAPDGKHSIRNLIILSAGIIIFFCSLIVSVSWEIIEHPLAFIIPASEDIITSFNKPSFYMVFGGILCVISLYLHQQSYRLYRLKEISQDGLHRR